MPSAQNSLRLFSKGLLILAFSWWPHRAMAQSLPGSPVPASAQPAAAPSANVPDEIIVAAVGDVMTHAKVIRSAKANGNAENFQYGFAFESLTKYFQAADINFANLETPAALKDYNKRRPFVFNADANLVRALKWGGFNLLSVANNHSLDQSVKGLRDTLALGMEESLPMIGAGGNQISAEAGFCQTIRSLNVCSVAFTRVGIDTWHKVLKPKKTWLNFDNSDEEIVRILRELKAKADILIVSIHWGEEYQTRPAKWQKKLAQKMVDAGADLILGHHPHVLQKTEVLTAASSKHSALVAYSLGNFLSNQSQHFSSRSTDPDEGRPRDSLILTVHLSKSGLQKVEGIPLWTLNSSDRGTAIEIKSIESLLADFESKEKKLADDKVKNKIEIKKIHDMNAFLTTRKQIIEKTVFPKIEQITRIVKRR